MSPGLREKLAAIGRQIAEKRGLGPDTEVAELIVCPAARGRRVLFENRFTLAEAEELVGLEKRAAEEAGGAEPSLSAKTRTSLPPGAGERGEGR